MINVSSRVRFIGPSLAVLTGATLALVGCKDADRGAAETSGQGAVHEPRPHDEPPMARAPEAERTGAHDPDAQVVKGSVGPQMEPQGPQLEAQGPSEDESAEAAGTVPGAGPALAQKEWTELSAQQGHSKFIRALRKELKRDEYDVQQAKVPGHEQAQLLIVIPAGDTDDDGPIDIERLLDRVRLVAVMPSEGGEEQSRIVYGHEPGAGGITQPGDPVFAAISRAGGVALMAAEPPSTNVPINAMETDASRSQDAAQRAAEEDDEQITDPILDPDEPRPDRPQPPEPSPEPPEPPDGDGDDAVPPPL